MPEVDVPDARRRRPATSRAAATPAAANGGGGDNSGGGNGIHAARRRSTRRGEPRQPRRQQRSGPRSAARATRTRWRRPSGHEPGRLADPGQPDLLAARRPGAARIGVPNFFIDKFRIPPFLLPIYQAAGIQYGVRWEILAAINEIETDYGRNLNVSSAGALGWMQFMPSTWRAYGVDANGDKVKDPYNPVDAIFAAARYLRAAGADQDIRARRLRLQPRRLVRRLRAAARPGHRRPAVEPRRLAHRPHAGPLPDPGQGHLRRRARARAASACATATRRWSSSRPAAAGSASSRASARRWSRSTTGGSCASATTSGSATT